MSEQLPEQCFRQTACTETSAIVQRLVSSTELGVTEESAGFTLANMRLRAFARRSQLVRDAMEDVAFRQNPSDPSKVFETLDPDIAEGLIMYRAGLESFAENPEDTGEEDGIRLREILLESGQNPAGCLAVTQCATCPLAFEDFPPTPQQ